MKRVIRIGDPTDHKGVVLAGCSTYLIHGRAVARVGDACSCPVPGHGRCTIVEGDPEHCIGGIPVAFEGCRTDCGAVLISSLDAYTAG
ncbi:MAG TPA: PAAR domain-containing protein [Holophaga sp.]|nr:PAAR domain-containing protein [Holophaga sp.]